MLECKTWHTSSTFSEGLRRFISIIQLIKCTQAHTAVLPLMSTLKLALSWCLGAQQTVPPNVIGVVAVSVVFLHFLRKYVTAMLARRKWRAIAAKLRMERDKKVAALPNFRQVSTPSRN